MSRIPYASYWSSFVPKSWDCFQKGYTQKTLLSDLTAGLTVGIISLPLAMAFAIGAGLPPEKGLYTAIIAGFLISLLGGSRVQIGGPTGAYIVIIVDIISRHGYQGLVTATFLAGLLLIGMGLMQFGALIRFIPYPVTTGFTTGIATVIFFSQLKDLAGLSILHPSPEFVKRLIQYVQCACTFNLTAFLLGMTSLFGIFWLRRINRRLPGTALVVIASALLSALFQLPIETIHSQFGEIPQQLPQFMWPEFTSQMIEDVFPDALTVALLGAIESLLSAMVADGMTGFRHKPNCELIAQGIANISSSLFGGMPATGAIARTTANIQMHGRTPLAGMINAITLLILMIICAPLAGYIPLCTLAAVLIYVAWNMSEIDHFKEILKSSYHDIVVLITTFFLTIFVDLTAAVQVGVLLAACLFLHQMSEKTTIKIYQALHSDPGKEVGKTHDPLSIEAQIKNHNIQIFEIEGPFFFGVTEILNEALKNRLTTPDAFILRLRTVPFIDASGAHAIKIFFEKCSAIGTRLFIAETPLPLEKQLKKAGLIHLIGQENVQPTLHSAITAAKKSILSRK